MSKRAIPAADRNCFMCVHLTIREGGGGCDTCGYGGEASIKCDKGYFDSDLDRQVAGDINRARTCEKFAPDDSALARFGEECES